MEYDAIIVGAGISGLTAAAYLAQAGRTVLLCEKQEKCGGLVNNFEYEGFIYDGGIRALENSGVLFPMLRQLGISIDFVPNRISIGMEDQVILVDTDESIHDYKNLLIAHYPDNRDEIEKIIQQIRTIMKYMDVQYGIDNPLFLDMKKDWEYMLKEIIPWMFKYALTTPKISKMKEPVLDYLKRYTCNQSLLDIIAQHFFQETPAYFALSYLKIYLDYHYPVGGTGTIIRKLEDFIIEHGGSISKNTEIIEVDLENQLVKDSQGSTHSYRRLVWAADLRTLYRLVDPAKVLERNTREKVLETQKLLSDKSGNDSIYSVYLGLDLEKEYFTGKCTEHFFYTPSRTGQSAAGPIPINQDRLTTEKWLDQFWNLTTYEISIPVLRDSTLAPSGKTGLIISALFDYRLTRQIEMQGWYPDFKSLCEQKMISVLNATIFPGIENAVLHVFSSTPLTVAKLNGSHEGAITGWSFTNQPVPAESRLPKIMSAIKTPIPGVYQAGQWTYSPSGLPISFLTGKIAADQVLKDLKKAGSR